MYKFEIATSQLSGINGFIYHWEEDKLFNEYVILPYGNGKHISLV
jgi:hypothetical protein